MLVRSLLQTYDSAASRITVGKLLYADAVDGIIRASYKSVIRRRNHPLPRKELK